MERRRRSNAPARCIQPVRPCKFDGYRRLWKLCRRSTLTSLNPRDPQMVILRSNILLLLFTSLIWTLVQPSISAAQQNDNIFDLEKSFASPPDDCRIMMRWWWFGPAVTKPELQRELEQMKAEGIGGVEIATLYPLALDDLKLDDKTTGFHNQPFLSDEHLDAIRFAATTPSWLDAGWAGCTSLATCD